MLKRKIIMYDVELTRENDSMIAALPIDFYLKLDKLTNNYTITNPYNPTKGVWVSRVNFKTCKDWWQIIKAFGDDWDIYIKYRKIREVKENE